MVAQDVLFYVQCHIFSSSSFVWLCFVLLCVFIVTWFYISNSGQLSLRLTIWLSSAIAFDGFEDRDLNWSCCHFVSKLFWSRGLMTSSPGNLNSIRTVLREQRVCQQSWHFINLIKRHTKYLCAVFVFEYRKNEPIGIFFFVHWRHLLDIFSAHAGLLHTCWWILKRADKNQKRKKNINAYLQIERYKKWLWNVWMQFVWTNHTIHAFTRTIDTHTHIAHRTLHHGIGFCACIGCFCWHFFRLFSASLSIVYMIGRIVFKCWPNEASRDIFSAYFYIQMNLLDTWLCVCLVCVRAGISLSRPVQFWLVYDFAHTLAKRNRRKKDHWIAKRISYAHVNALQITSQCCARHTFMHSHLICYSMCSIALIGHTLCVCIIAKCECFAAKKKMIKFPNWSSKQDLLEWIVFLLSQRSCITRRKKNTSKMKYKKNSTFRNVCGKESSAVDLNLKKRVANLPTKSEHMCKKVRTIMNGGLPGGDSSSSEYTRFTRSERTTHWPVLPVSLFNCQYIITIRSTMPTAIHRSN